ncbi:MAG: hypothetical protein AAFX03_11810 [Pseudomonadota bacterium]
MRARAETPFRSRAPDRTAGFVLPYVLAMIAVLSLIAALGANALRRSQTNVLALERLDTLQRALDAVEAETLYVFTTSNFARSGIDLSDRVVDQTALSLGEAPDESELDPADVWLATGQTRRTLIGGVPVYVAYQDADGLISLSSANDLVLGRLLGGFGLPPAQARGLVRKLNDYTDADHRRQFEGGERADYRLERRPPPTNSSLRSWQEIRSILDWDEVNLSASPEFIRLLTFFTTASIPNTSTMPPEVAEAMEVDEQGLDPDQSDLADYQWVTNTYPSPRARFILTAISPDGRSGLRRIVEAERTSTAPDQPFTRRLVIETGIGPDEIERLDWDGTPRLGVSASSRNR